MTSTPAARKTAKAPTTAKTPKAKAPKAKARKTGKSDASKARNQSNESKSVRRASPSSAASAPRKSTGFASRTTFADLVPQLHPATLKALSDDFGYHMMSRPQATYLPHAMEGRDLLVRARTGSGKTLGFLLPLVQRLAAEPAAATAATERRSAAAAPLRSIRALVLSPSRELAEQTFREAKRVIQFHASMGVQVVIGGTNMGAEAGRLKRELCDILVATPGRLLDHISNTPGVAARLGGVRVLVLDEADRLLDMGFAPAIRQIASVLSDKHSRQTLLFTATIPEGVKQVAKQFMRDDLTFIDTADDGDDGDAARNANNIVQEYVVLPVDSLVPALYRIVRAKREANPDNHRIIVFVQTALMAQLMTELFRKAGMTDAMEMHSRLTQSQRTATTERFRRTSAGLMFASDVIARGVDFPDVSLVIQLGIASDAEQVVHRTGRTGRGGKLGEAILLLGDDEREVLEKEVVTRLPVKESTGASAISAGVVSGSAVAPPPELRAAFDQIKSGGPLARDACRAFVATLGFYNGNMRRLRWSPQAMVDAVSQRFAAMGSALPGACPVQSKTLGKMRLKGVSGLEISASDGSGVHQQQQRPRPRQQQQGFIRRW